MVRQESGITFCIISCPFKDLVTGMNIFSTVELSYKYVIIAFNYNITRIKDQSFNQNIYKDW